MFSWMEKRNPNHRQKSFQDRNELIFKLTLGVFKFELRKFSCILFALYNYILFFVHLLTAYTEVGNPQRAFSGRRESFETKSKKLFLTSKKFCRNLSSKYKKSKKLWKLVVLCRKQIKNKFSDLKKKSCKSWQFYVLINKYDAQKDMSQ